jgi:hypothetical protein
MEDVNNRCETGQMEKTKMKTLKHRRTFLKTLGMLIAAGAIAAGLSCFCAGCMTCTPPRPKPVTVAQIVDMSKSGVLPDQIISKIRASGTVYRLKASQLIELSQKGVSDAVIDYMQETYLDAIKRDAAYKSWRYWAMYGDYWYGGAPFGWPYDTTYTIRERPPEVLEPQPEYNELHPEYDKPQLESREPAAEERNETRGQEKHEHGHP